MRAGRLVRTTRRDASAAHALSVAVGGGITLVADGAFNHGAKRGGIQRAR